MRPESDAPDVFQSLKWFNLGDPDGNQGARRTGVNFGLSNKRRKRSGYTEIYKPIMNDATKRSILRWIHIVFGIPILGYIYGEPSEVQQYAAAVRVFFLPVIVLSGFWNGKAMSFDDLFRKDRPNTTLGLAPAQALVAPVTTNRLPPNPFGRANGQSQFGSLPAVAGS